MPVCRAMVALLFGAVAAASAAAAAHATTTTTTILAGGGGGGGGGGMCAAMSVCARGDAARAAMSRSEHSDDAAVRAAARNVSQIAKEAFTNTDLQGVPAARLGDALAALVPASIAGPIDRDDAVASVLRCAAGAARDGAPWTALVETMHIDAVANVSFAMRYAMIAVTTSSAAAAVAAVGASSSAAYDMHASQSRYALTTAASSSSSSSPSRRDAASFSCAVARTSCVDVRSGAVRAERTPALPLDARAAAYCVLLMDVARVAGSMAVAAAQRCPPPPLVAPRAPPSLLGVADMARVRRAFAPLGIVPIALDDDDAPPSPPSPSSSSIIDKANAFASAVKQVADAWTSLAAAFKTKTTVTIERIKQLGFSSFASRATTFKLEGVPAARTDDVRRTIAAMYTIPPDGVLALTTIEYTSNFTWSLDQATYATALDSHSATRILYIFKYGDARTDMADFLVVDMTAQFELAPDLLIVHTQRSVLGGLFESDKTRIERTPHTLTPDDILQLRYFFYIVAFGRLAAAAGIPYAWPMM